jgi:hypothetical protein
MHVLHAAALVMLVSFQGSQPATKANSLVDTDRAAILKTLGLKGNPRGQVMNECGELSTPQFLPAELGGAVGTATLFAMSGGPNTASCYGDGPDLHLMTRSAAGWKEIYAARGRMLIVLPTSTAGVRDIADGGPGMSFPIWAWNGTRYAATTRSISDAQLSKIQVKFLP